MRARSAYHRTCLVVASLAAFGCHKDQGPSPNISLSIQGQVLSADPVPVPIAGATVALWGFKGLLGNAQRLARTTTDPAGHYQLAYTFASECAPADNTTDWIEASAERYETATSHATSGFSDPVIYCTNELQVIDLTLQPFGWLTLISNTTRSELDPDGYTPVLTGTFPYPHGDRSQAYPMGVNAEQTLELLPGQFTLELTEVAGNCTVAGGNPRTITVAPRDTVLSTSQVSCAP